MGRTSEKVAEGAPVSTCVNGRGSAVWFPSACGSALLAVVAACALVLSMALVALSPVKLWAASAVDTEAPVSLELNLAPEDDPAEGVEFRAYRVGDVAFTGELSPTEIFAGYGLSFEDATAESWATMAEMLAEAVSADELPDDAVALTDESGVARFSDLPVGLYLVVGDQFRIDGADVIPAPFMVCLPDRSATDEWIYDVKADVKHQTTVDEKLPETGKDKLPQTGQLWWPVPVLLVAGLGLIAAGLVRRSKA